MTTPSPCTELFSRWCNCRAKRGFDLVCGSVLLVVSLPLMVAAAVLIRLTSAGPILFRHKRLGKCGTEIIVLKFRTMVHRTVGSGPEVTSSGDRRITPAGRLLRKWKIDELPQLFNVLRGDMSLVGPRPDLPEYLSQLRSEQLAVLALIPGITSPASVQFRDEEALLCAVPAEQVESYYVNALLPQKIALELDYARSATLASDIAMLLRTAAAVLH